MRSTQKVAEKSTAASVEGFVQAAVRRLNLTEGHRVRALVYGIDYAIAFVSTLMFVVHGTRPDAGDASPGSRLSHSASSWPSGVSAPSSPGSCGGDG
jgi:hypothetical protein